MLVSIALLLLYAILLVVVLFSMLLVLQQFKVAFLNEAPFVPVRSKAVPEVIDALSLTNNSVLYDLGCGDGRVLVAAAVAFPENRGVGVERNWIPWLLARKNTRGLPISIYRENMFSVSLSDATHLYCYLLTTTLSKFEPKIRAECRPGTRIVTCDFSFPTLIPIETRVIPGSVSGLARTLYIYEL